MKQTPDEKQIKLYHKALSSFPVLIYNGETDPVVKTLPDAFLSISSDLRQVKADTRSANELLKSKRERQLVYRQIHNFWASIVRAYKFKRIWKIFGTLLTLYALVTAFPIVIKIFTHIYHWFSF